MSAPLQVFPTGLVESISKVLGEAGSGSEIARFMESCKLIDFSGQSTKWRKLNAVFMDSQQRTQSPNQMLSFIKEFLAPHRFVGKISEFEAHRKDLNLCLALAGLEFGADGQFRTVAAAKTLDQAEERLNTIRSKLKGRSVHSEVLKYCRIELLQDNYFHAVFEANKGLAQRIRDLSSIQLDGAALVDKVFSSKQPILAFNAMQTVTEQSEHLGFANLLKGCFSAVRNPLAHGPKILWNGEDDAADYLSLISLLHRKLDSCVPTNLGVQP